MVIDSRLFALHINELHVHFYVLLSFLNIYFLLILGAWWTRVHHEVQADGIRNNQYFLCEFTYHKVYETKIISPIKN